MSHVPKIDTTLSQVHTQNQILIIVCFEASSVGPDSHGLALLDQDRDPNPYWECWSEETDQNKQVKPDLQPFKNAFHLRTINIKIKIDSTFCDVEVWQWSALVWPPGSGSALRRKAGSGSVADPQHWFRYVVSSFLRKGSILLWLCGVIISAGRHSHSPSYIWPYCIHYCIVCKNMCYRGSLPPPRH
jgi:hypothetical protein